MLEIVEIMKMRFRFVILELMEILDFGVFAILDFLKKIQDDF